jgi:aspartate racemase
MHKRIGILGGLTAESTLLYYQHIVRRYQELRGDSGYPEIVIFSVSFQQFEDWMERGEWDTIAGRLEAALGHLAAAGADFAVMATNTMHIHFDRLSRSSPIPLVSIIDATADAVGAAGLNTVALLGTRFTMEMSFYADGLARRGIKSLAPDAGERDAVHRIIIDELSRGQVREQSRAIYLRIIDRLARAGAQGVVLGCTEIPLLVRPEHTTLPLFDTAAIHAEAALMRALE